jgi:hypothetical protein
VRWRWHGGAGRSRTRPGDWTDPPSTGLVDPCRPVERMRPVSGRGRIVPRPRVGRPCRREVSHHPRADCVGLPLEPVAGGADDELRLDHWAAPADRCRHRRSWFGSGVAGGALRIVALRRHRIVVFGHGSTLTRLKVSVERSRRTCACPPSGDFHAGRRTHPSGTPGATQQGGMTAAVHRRLAPADLDPSAFGSVGGRHDLSSRGQTASAGGHRSWR